MINVDDIDLVGTPNRIGWAHDILVECVKIVDNEEKADDFLTAIAVNADAKWVIDNQEGLVCGDCSDPIFYLKAYLSEMTKLDILFARGEEDSYIIEEVDLSETKCVDVDKTLYQTFWEIKKSRESMES